MKLIFDIEANGLYEEATKIWCIVAQDLATSKIYKWTIEDKEPIETILEVLYNATELIGHSIINYDLPLLKKLHNWQPSPHTLITDTLVRSRLLNPDREKPRGYKGKGGPHSLECYGYKVGKWKLQVEDWSFFDSEKTTRCLGDVEINQLSFFLQEAEMSDWNWTDSEILERGISRIMTEQEHTGIPFNSERGKGYVSFLATEIKKIDDEIVPRLPWSIEKIGTGPVNNPFLKTGGYTKRVINYVRDAYQEDGDFDFIGGPFNRIKFKPFELGSTPRIKDYLLAEGWTPDIWNYSKTTGERTSPKLEGDFRGVDGHIPVQVKKRISLVQRKSRIEGWLGLVRPDGRISGGANTCGTNTGRMKHYNVVNIPKANADDDGNLIWDIEKQEDLFGTQMRSLFYAEEGYKLVGHDASGLELRMLAHYLEDEEFTRQILEGDIHEYNREIAGLPDRNAAKTFIYAFIYGAGNEKLGSIIGGSAADGEELKRRFLRAIPKLEKLINSVKRASGKGFLKGLDGRKVWMRRDDNGRIKRSTALNVLLQSAGAIVMKKSAVLLDTLVKRYELDVRKVLDMHDEAQAEVAYKDVDKYCECAVDSVVWAGDHFNLNIPLAAEAKVGKNMAETH